VNKISLKKLILFLIFTRLFSVTNLTAEQITCYATDDFSVLPWHELTHTETKEYLKDQLDFDSDDFAAVIGFSRKEFNEVFLGPQNRQVLTSYHLFKNNTLKAGARWPTGAWMGDARIYRHYQCMSNDTVKVKETEIVNIGSEKENDLSQPNAVQQMDLTVSSSAYSSTNVFVHGTVKNKNLLSFLNVGDVPVVVNDDGSFKTSIYVPRTGLTVEVVAVALNGQQVSKTINLQRGTSAQTSGPIFAALNPSGKRVKSNKNALALIIGVADYQRTSAKAAYADKDAQTFYDYAMLKLGIPAGNIKELVNNSAGEVDVRLAVKDWIARSIKQGQSDIYVFFAGHGLANQSGEEMYLLPYDGSPRLLEESAISRERLFADISAANPRSVTVFLDTCYSGTTRGTDMLIASRPIAIRALEQSIPDNFTVMTAAAGDQTAKPLEEAKHGMFSYFLMKGMEGEADANNDNEITAGELHSYVQTNVIQQSSGSQTPELQGDADRVLVRFQ